MVLIELTERDLSLSELMEKLEESQGIVITRDGEPIAEISQPDLTQRRKNLLKSLDNLAEFRASLKPLRRPSVEVLREMRDEGW